MPQEDDNAIAYRVTQRTSKVLSKFNEVFWRYDMLLKR